MLEHGRQVGSLLCCATGLGTTVYLYDGSGIWANVIEAVDNSGNILARYTQEPGVDRPIAELRSGTTSYYEADGLGTVSSLSNSSASLANTYTYDSFGRLIGSTGTITNPFQYTGRESDSETNLDYYRFRYFDPNSGRFLSEDPITFEGGIDFYEYVRNGPLDYNDPFGLRPKRRPLPPPPPVPNPIPNDISNAYNAFLNCTNNSNIKLKCMLPEPPGGNPFEPPGGPNGDMGVTPNEGSVPLPQYDVNLPDACACLMQHPAAALDPRFTFNVPNQTGISPGCEVSFSIW